jgi:curli biogenesis system outer membrane secretion channel CsgG
MKTALVTLLCSLLVLGLAEGGRAGDAKPRIAVLEFTETDAGHWSGHVGKAAEDWFVDSLVNTQRFTVLERKQLDAILAEKNFDASGHVSQTTAAKVGKMAGVQVVVFGTIHFAQSKQEVHSRSGLGPFNRIPIWGSGSKKTSEGTLTARAVSVQSGEVLFSKSETVSSSSFDIDVMGTGAGTDWDDTVARKLFQPAVEKLTDEMVAKIEGIKGGLGDSATGGEGKVVSVKTGMVYVNLGKGDGIKVGDAFEVFRAEIIRDPDTKEELGRDERPLGVISVDRIGGDHLAICRIDSGSGFAVGDVAKRR